MQAIQVKFLGATNFRSARVKAFCANGESHTESFRYESRDYTSQVLEVAQGLLSKLQWNSSIIGCGQLPNGDYAIILGDIRHGK